MTGWRQLRGSIVLSVLIACVLGVRVIQWDPSSPVEAPPLFSFEPQQLAEIRISREDGELHFRRKNGEWSYEGQPWRPNEAMMRRVAHQLNGLSARSEVTSPADNTAYGFDVTVQLTFNDGPSIAFEVGQTNPTGVSYYLRDTRDGKIYLVKKAAVDYFRAPEVEYREPRFFQTAAEDVQSVELSTAEFHWKILRDGDGWRMVEPGVAIVDPPVMRELLGRLTAAKVVEFSEGEPKDSQFGLQNPVANLTLGTGKGSQSYQFGKQSEKGYYVRWNSQVVVLRAAVLDAIQRSPEELESKRLVYGETGDLRGITLTRGGRTVVLRNGVDGWMWADKSKFQGQTADRIAARAVGLERLGPALPFETAIRLRLTWDEREVEVSLSEDGAAATVGSQTASVVPDLKAAIDDLFRESERQQR